ncbi:hypothetical protein CYMTET_34949 [Cymbomonas tetramitiformis]|uniref:Formin-like protein n=1 Tax=Cymbomonas tetramitiformis TaxID=36881 RepID=A0AAE0FA33_9CHLO|nr:hypothetical protein CYMTET_34949 [Cymbomonas tetramitiformis]
MKFPKHFRRLICLAPSSTEQVQESANASLDDKEVASSAQPTSPHVDALPEDLPHLSETHGEALTPQVRLVRLNWTKFPGSRVPCGCVFDSEKGLLAQTTSKLDLELCAEVFKQKDAKLKAKGDQPGRSKPHKAREVRLLDHKRSHQGSIVLARFSLSFQEIRRALEDYDTTSITLDQAFSLVPLVPTAHERNLLTAYKGEVDNLGPVERYFLEVLQLPQYETHIHTFIFVQIYETELLRTQRFVEALNQASLAVVGSRSLREVLGLLLEAGNFLNAGTSRGKANGFAFSSLLDVPGCKSQQLGNVGLLDFLLFHCWEQVEHLPEELAPLEAIRSVPVELLALQLNELQGGMELVRSHMERMAEPCPPEFEPGFPIAHGHVCCEEEAPPTQVAIKLDVQASSQVIRCPCEGRCACSPGSR